MRYRITRLLPVFCLVAMVVLAIVVVFRERAEINLLWFFSGLPSNTTDKIILIVAFVFGVTGMFTSMVLGCVRQPNLYLDKQNVLESEDGKYVAETEVAK